MSALPVWIQNAVHQQPLGLVVFAFLILTFMWGFWHTVTGFRSIAAVKRAIEDVRADRALSAGSAIQPIRRLATLVDRLGRHETNVVALEHDVTIIERALTIPISRARTSAGILIILGLLLTLVNLRAAV